MLAEAVRQPTLYTSQTAQRRAQSPPNLPDRHRIFPDQTSAVRNRGPPSENRKIGGMSAESAHSIFRRIPARMLARARAKCVETCSPGQEIPHMGLPAGMFGGLCELSARWRASCRTMYIVFPSALLVSQRQSDGEGYAGRLGARVVADVALGRGRKNERKVELAAITLCLHLAGLELHERRRACCELRWFAWRCS
ncbi:uncharacterized protein SCHCODRAFT_02715873 [Schizophyllum commune H4-8]|uniref:uncharacterized protein n=1 Tax=Schizophyllum commune (strain H4-8 / FGSC 9210) TaxID=578458 RepID=UPI002160856A|nr:uncharacterized protein SCHCODRAFT_02715873 [Schizophyllum commune H4-8]KAI5886268.1 hypothetical protein SCHCODRAFT_02715873 [Schizophyllum commune H4-8]